MIKFNGIYDDKILSAIKNISDITAIGFDFFPKSFNYIQEYRFLEMIDQFYKPELDYFLHFRHEKSFVIEKLLNDLTTVLEKKSPAYFPMNKVVLEFSGTPTFDQYDQLERAYYVHFDHEIPLAVYEQAQYLKGIIFDYSFLNLVHESGEWEIFYHWYQNSLLPLIKLKRLKLVLQREWSDNVFSSLYSQIDFNYVALSMGSEVEHSYRKPNIEMILSQINMIINEVK